MSATKPPKALEMLPGYKPLAGHWDEMCTASGEVRPAWRRMMTRFGEMGAGELNRRHEESRRLVRESGVAEVFGDTPGAQTWDLDPLPLILSSDDWRVLQPGLVQRARLMNRILGDIYGQQMLLRNGLIPPDLILAHPGFLRPAHGLATRGGHLQLLSVDAVRGADGQWRVIREGTQTPSGMGIALENRLTLLRMFPEIYQECNTRRLLPFFRQMRETLHALAPRQIENPRIVLLTPGPSSPNYFEHVYLARYLGFTLVEGSDLTVRDNAVYVKTLGGLLPVDVILRGVNDSQCDPLEFRYESHIGVAGLVQATQAGNVAITNALGSGVLDSPSFMPFLPAICKTLLGESLKLPSTPTHWCGERTPLEHVVKNLDRMVVYSAFSLDRAERYAGGAMTAPQRAELVARMRQRPYAYSAHEITQCSTTPVFRDGQITPAYVAARFFVVAKGDDYEVMTGGLSRIAEDPATLYLRSACSGMTQDTWVISDKPLSAPSLLQHVSRAMPLARNSMDMPSRVADNLYWVGRYAERAEGTVRLLRALLARLTMDQAPEDLPEMRAMVSIMYALDLLTGTPPTTGEGVLGAKLAEQVLLAVVAPARPGNLREIVEDLRRTGAVVRDRISVDAWRLMNQLSEALEQVSTKKMKLSEALVLLNNLILPLASFSGLVMESMTRGPAWRFLDMGRRVERAQYTTTLLNATLCSVEGSEPPVLQALLEIADSAMTYRSRYLSSLQAPAVVDLLLTDESNPRSTGFQLAALASHIEGLPRPATVAQRDPEQRLIYSSLHAVRMAVVDELCTINAEGVRPKLALLLGQLDEELPALSNVISRRYFSHAETPRILAGGWNWTES